MDIWDLLQHFSFMLGFGFHLHTLHGKGLVAVALLFAGLMHPGVLRTLEAAEISCLG